MSSFLTNSMASSSAGPIAVKVSQREIRSCGYCYRRKVKCDKVFPCTRCRQRGLGDLCEQQTSIVRGRIRGAEGTETRSPEVRRPRQKPTFAELEEENRALLRRLAAQEKALNSLLHRPEDRREHHLDEDPQSRWPGSPIPGEARSSKKARALISTQVPLEPDGEEEIRDVEEPHDYLATVRDIFGMQNADGSSDASQQPKLIFTERSSTTLDGLHVMVPLGYSDFLVKYHCHFLHWIHGVFHIPTYLNAQHEWITGLRNGTSTRQSYDFLALYFAIIACSLHFLDDFEAGKLGLTQEAISILPRFWFDISINCLQLSSFMVRPTFAVLQTICILPMVAHAFDASKYISSLMHCGLGLAQELNLHLRTVNSTHTRALGFVHAELGRRIWWCLKIRESLSPGVYPTNYLLYPSKSTVYQIRAYKVAAPTTSPANTNDSDLIDGWAVTSQPYSQITDVTYLIAMGLRADLFREFVSDYGKKQSLSSRHRSVKAFARRIEAILDAFPDLKPNPEEVYPLSFDPCLPFDYTPWARFINATSTPCCVIILHQQFFSRSYQDSRFMEDRIICLDAARSIMTARRKRVPLLFQKNWHVSSETIIAAMTLAIDRLHGQHEEISKRTIRDEILEAIDILKTLDTTNVMIPRGIRLLQTMLAGEGTATTSASNDPTVSQVIPMEDIDLLSWSNLDLVDLGDDLFNTLLQMDTGSMFTVQ